MFPFPVEDLAFKATIFSEGCIKAESALFGFLVKFLDANS
jgi:hypothetical protein